MILFLQENGASAAELPKYVDMPEKYRYEKKEWIPRKRGIGNTIGRVHAINPVAGEVYYLRVLLHNDHCRGKKSFQDMLTLASGRLCETFKEVCFELGLMNDDQEWYKVLEQSSATQMCSQSRETYVILLIFCFPADPAALFNQFWDTWYDDFQRKSQRRGITLTETQLKTMVLLDLQLRLSSFEKPLKEYGLHVPTLEEVSEVEHINSTQPAVFREEMEFDYEELKVETADKVSTLTRDQKAIYEEIMNSVRTGQPLQMFIDARGGCGKTYLENTILGAVRTMEPGGCIALAMATTGIAANLLTLGRTFHSRMKAPLTPSETSLQE